MVRIQVDIYESPDGTMIELPMGHSEDFTDREKEIAETIADIFMKECASIKKGTTHIIDNNIQPGA